MNITIASHSPIPLSARCKSIKSIQMPLSAFTSRLCFCFETNTYLRTYICTYICGYEILKKNLWIVSLSRAQRLKIFYVVVLNYIFFEQMRNIINSYICMYVHSFTFKQFIFLVLFFIVHPVWGATSYR